MFHFPGCPSHELWIHSWMTAHYHSRVPPFGNSRIKAYLQLPQAFRSLSRPSSAISALASTLRSSSLDLASSVTTAFLRLLRSDCNCFDLCSDLERLLLTGIFRIRSRSSSQKSVSFPVQFSRCVEVSCEPSKRYRAESIQSDASAFRLSYLNRSYGVACASPAVL